MTHILHSEHGYYLRKGSSHHGTILRVNGKWTVYPVGEATTAYFDTLEDAEEAVALFAQEVA